MIIQSIQNRKYKQKILNTIPEEFQLLFEQIKQEHYEELYEPEADGTDSLQDALKKGLELILHSNEKLAYCRSLWMTLILILSVEPTLEYYDPNNLLPKQVINFISSVLIKNINNKINTKMIDNYVLDELITEIFKSHESYFQHKEANFQEINEALDVFYNAIKVIKHDQSVEAILEILYDCLEGYAIFPGSYGRRELFDWWLLDVVPASYNLLPPKSFYVVEGVKNKEEIRLRQTRLVNKISKEIRSALQELESKKHNNYIFPTPGKLSSRSFKNSGKIEYQSKIPQPAYS
ncbi:hypothetical protein [Anabaena sp. PCC 7108]|uniref:hypothetical protein n=1 Tax=Anabaena sp. PCC 7108 TaxID=163908 RepID=UPI00034504FB|nr:hypothetical protein [Anabaena sp. PCC 7108]